MANLINNVKDVGSIISKISAGMLEDQFQFIKTVDKEPESSFTGQTNGFNHGDTINISKPARFGMGTTADITSTIQDIVEEKVPLVLDKQRNVAVELTSADISTDLSLKSWSNRILKPAMSRLAQGIEAECLELAQDAVYNSVGDADGTTVFDTATMLAARTKLRQNLSPMGEEYALLDSVGMSSAVVARKGQFQSSEAISKQYKSGYMGIADGFHYLENELIATHANGADVTGIAVNDASVAEGASTLTIDGASAAVTIGSVFTIAGVFSVHPITKVATTVLQQFVATTSSTTSIGISPSIYAASDGLQNVTALPADNAALVFVGAATNAYKNNLAYCKDAFRFISVPLVTPGGTDLASSSTVNGITVRAIRDYDVLADKLILRLDVLYGFTAVRPEWAVKIAG